MKEGDIVELVNGLVYEVVDELVYEVVYIKYLKSNYIISLYQRCGGLII
jgi:hypothetical protein